MKSRILKSIAAALSALLLALGSPKPAVANDMDFFGSGGNPVWKFSDDVKVYGDVHDFFGTDSKDLEPGSKMAKLVQLRNYGPTDAIFGLRITPVDQPESEGLADSGNYGRKIGMASLLSEIDAKISYESDSGSKLIYEGALSGNGIGSYSSDGIVLGTLNPNKYGDINIELEIPENLSNDYANTLCAVKWVFLVEQLEAEPTPSPMPPTASPTASPTPMASETPLPPNAPTSAPSSPEQPYAPEYIAPYASPTPTPAPITPTPEAVAPSPAPIINTGGLEADDYGPADTPEHVPPNEEDPSKVLGEGGLIVASGAIPVLPQTGRLTIFAEPLKIALAVLILAFLSTFIRKKAKTGR
ncbi:MAG: hypothetical protein LBU32_07370 [Clostridiales bacterium]|jgi:hypothetical protein|nr:hypothetical protein [Clostridiales bacterium]